MATTESSRIRLAFATFDVFTETRLKGNPLAIVKVPKDCVLEQSLKQAIAREFNFSETVFLHEAEDESSLDRRIDIFTTTTELPFAGHPTIGSICCIGARSIAASAQAFTVMTKAGSIQSKYAKGKGWAAIPHHVHIHGNSLTRSKVESLYPSIDARPQDDLVDLWPLGSSGSFLDFPVVSIVKGMTFILIEFPNVEHYLQRLKVGRQMKYADAISLDGEWTPSFAAPYFYSILSEGIDQPTRIRARMIEPQIGEDPATGSAACTLGAYLALQSDKGGKTFRFNVEQGVEMGRASEIGVEVVLDESGEAVEEVLLSGTAIQVTEGTLML